MHIINSTDLDLSNDLGFGYWTFSHWLQSVFIYIGVKSEYSWLTAKWTMDLHKIGRDTEGMFANIAANTLWRD